MEVVYESIEVFICILEAYLMFDFFHFYFPLRDKIEKRYTGLVVVLFLSCCVRFINQKNSNTINLIGMQVIYISALMGLFVGSVMKKMFCYLVALMIMMGSEFLLMIPFSYASDFSAEDILRDKSEVYVLLLGVKMLAYFVFRIVKQISAKEQYKMELKNFLFFSVLPIGTLGIMLAVEKLNIDYSGNRLTQIVFMVCLILLMVGDILAFYVYEKLWIYIETAKKQEFQIVKMKSEEKRYEEIEKANQEQTRFLHDMKHFLRTIGELTAEHKESEVAELLLAMQDKISGSGFRRYTHNSLVNTIINEKKKEAEKRGVLCEVNCEPDFSLDYVECMDLIALVSNLLDNAIEAAALCKNGHVYVYLYTWNYQNFSVIKIVNNYQGKIKKKNGKLLTTKKEEGCHGIGMQSASEVTRKYEGRFNFQYTKDEFAVLAVLPRELDSMK